MIRRIDSKSYVISRVINRRNYESSKKKIQNLRIVESTAADMIGEINCRYYEFSNQQKMLRIP